MAENNICAIWATPATTLPTDRDGLTCDSPRVGGRYFISGSAAAVIRAIDDRLKVRLTTWLVQQRAHGEDCPEITTGTIDEVKGWREPSVFDRADGILKYLSNRAISIGSRFQFSIEWEAGGERFETPLKDAQRTYFELLAHSDSCRSEELEFLLGYLSDQGLVERHGVNTLEQWCALTFSGYARLETLEQNVSPSSKGFVAMWFDPSMKAARDEGIKPAIRLSGYEPVVIDEKEHAGRIDDEIVSEIRRSRFVVADFTHGEDGARGGVYYEVGFAHGLGIPAILTCRSDKVAELHFDTRQYNHIVWKSPEELRTKLAKRISAVIGDGPLVAPTR
ncbi:MAG: hypothetical protein F4171_14135 [Gammaproteobacteria bacterium]|nr:hypothetical protein [Gammaproteobacteria bacterium]MYG13910.1 hypothetical protein [Gammaproteobacteria bacterium]MYK29724.1 hypothetical protein [Gammaproteobacteria bacterium]